MLASLHIENIALIENITISLGKGLNILSGETGAGKSIIIDSLNFVLGERADKTLIRYGAEKSVVEAVFDDLNAEINNYLINIGIDAEDVLIIRRVMSINGKNECRVNGQSVTLNTLKGLTELIVDIHGQHEHQSLLKTSTHITILDNFGGNNIKSQLVRVKKAYNNYRDLMVEFSRYGDAEERSRRVEVLEYQIDELSRADLQPNEEDNLLIQRKKFRNIEKIINSVNESSKLLNGSADGFSAVSAINLAKNQLSAVTSFDETLSELENRLDSAKIEVMDIAETLEGMLNGLQYDDLTADKVEKRIELIRFISRKYGGSIETAIEFLEKSKTEYDDLINADERCLELENKINKQAKLLIDECEVLHKIRNQSAVDLEGQINNQLAELGMSGAMFSVKFNEINNIKAEKCTINGYDEVEFLISANLGEPLKPLAKIISGGEMSRFMLALKNIIAKLDNISTMVFDEIDTGISGNIAQVVAEKLYNISHDRQVIAVTHLPQLASMADLHYKISKATKGDKTNTYLNLLNNDGEIEEIARLIGGDNYSEHALPHAMEMKRHSNKYKKAIINQ